ncbi:MAG: hypothetical protein ACOYL9_06930 [Ilumatobacteraceae bacterium]
MNRSRLADVLRVRRLQERGARGALARTNLAQRMAEEREALLWVELESHGARLGASGDLSSLAVARSAGLLMAERRHQETLDAIGAARIARAEWSAAARRVQGLERLDERLGEIEAFEADRADRNEVDDLVLARRAIARAEES